MATRTKADKRALVEFAKRALHGLDQSHMLLMLIDGSPMSAASAESMIQIGYAVLHGKRIIVPAPHGVEVPAKLAAVADAIVRYNPHDPQSLQHALVHTLVQLGSKKH